VSRKNKRKDERGRRRKEKERGRDSQEENRQVMFTCGKRMDEFSVAALPTKA